MADEIYSSSAWGSGVCDNEINWGKVYKDYAGCEDASFSYGAASYCTTDSNPTPTITGDAGGTFSASPAGMTIDSSTGRITLSSTTPQAYTVKYLLSGGTFATQTVTVNSCFVNAYSMSFDGIDDYLSCGTNSDLEIAGNVSISAWVYITAGSPYQGIVTKRDSGGTNYQFYTDNSATPLLRFYDGSTPSSSTGAVSLNAWHHVAITVDSGVTNGSTFYIDGVASGTGTWTITSNDAPLLIGATNTGVLEGYFTGNIDEAAVWDTVLGSAEITELYNSGVPTALDTDAGNYTSSADLQAWYRMGD